MVHEQTDVDPDDVLRFDPLVETRVRFANLSFHEQCIVNGFRTFSVGEPLHLVLHCSESEPVTSQRGLNSTLWAEVRNKIAVALAAVDYNPFWYCVLPKEVRGNVDVAFTALTRAPKRLVHRIFVRVPSRIRSTRLMLEAAASPKYTRDAGRSGALLGRELEVFSAVELRVALRHVDLIEQALVESNGEGFPKLPQAVRSALVSKRSVAKLVVGKSVPFQSLEESLRENTEIILQSLRMTVEPSATFRFLPYIVKGDAESVESISRCFFHLNEDPSDHGNGRGPADDSILYFAHPSLLRRSETFVAACLGLLSTWTSLTSTFQESERLRMESTRHPAWLSGLCRLLSRMDIDEMGSKDLDTVAETLRKTAAVVGWGYSSNSSFPPCTYEDEAKFTSIGHRAIAHQLALITDGRSLKFTSLEILGDAQFVGGVLDTPNFRLCREGVEEVFRWHPNEGALVTKAYAASKLGKPFFALFHKHMFHTKVLNPLITAFPEVVFFLPEEQGRNMVNARRALAADPFLPGVEWWDRYWKGVSGTGDEACATSSSSRRVFGVAQTQWLTFVEDRFPDIGEVVERLAHFMSDRVFAKQALLYYDEDHVQTYMATIGKIFRMAPEEVQLDTDVVVTLMERFPSRLSSLEESKADNNENRMLITVLRDVIRRTKIAQKSPEDRVRIKTVLLRRWGCAGISMDDRILSFSHPGLEDRTEFKIAFCECINATAWRYPSFELSHRSKADDGTTATRSNPELAWFNGQRWARLLFEAVHYLRRLFIEIKAKTLTNDDPKYMHIESKQWHTDHCKPKSRRDADPDPASVAVAVDVGSFNWDPLAQKTFFETKTDEKLRSISEALSRVVLKGKLPPGCKEQVEAINEAAAAIIEFIHRPTGQLATVDISIAGGAFDALVEKGAQDKETTEPTDSKKKQRTE